MWTRIPDTPGALSIGTRPLLMHAHGPGGGVKGNLAVEMSGSRCLIGLDHPGSGNRPMADYPVRGDALADEPAAVG